MRTLLAAITILATAAMSSAQQQEKKLIDRLLKPDTALQNEAQGKAFTVSGGTISTKPARSKFFFFARRPPEKTYTNVRQVREQEFRTHASPLGEQKARNVSRPRLAEADTAYVTSNYATRQAAGADRTVDVSEYSGTRPFLVRGKSQRTLSAQNRRPPLTVDQVRELLNKNK